MTPLDLAERFFARATWPEVERLFFIAEWNGITPEEYIAFVWERAQREAKGETRS